LAKTPNFFPIPFSNFFPILGSETIENSRNHLFLPCFYDFVESPPHFGQNIFLCKVFNTTLTMLLTDVSIFVVFIYQTNLNLTIKEYLLETLCAL